MNRTFWEWAKELSKTNPEEFEQLPERTRMTVLMDVESEKQTKD
jgi:hypothetical protein